MKKQMLLMASLLVASVAVADDGFIVPDVTTAPGKTAQVEVKISSATALYKGYQFDLNLAEGINIAETSSGAPQFSRTEATSLKEGDENIYTMTNAKISGGARYTCYSNPATAFPAGETALIKATITVPETTALGDYECTISAIECNTMDNVRTLFPDVTFTVKVVDPAELITVLDEESTTLPEAKEAAEDIKVKRTIKGGQWSTICLPFAMTEAQVKAAFGEDVEVAAFADYEADYNGDNVTGITVNFDEVDLSAEGGLYENYPYLIKTAGDISEFVVNSTITPNEADAKAEYDNGKSGRQRVVYGTFYGTLKAGATIPENNLFISDNKFWYSTGATTIKAFRGYFNFNDILADATGAGVKMFIGGKATKISEIEGQTGEEVIYDLSGRRVEKAQKGIYIINGKKVLKK